VQLRPGMAWFVEVRSGMASFTNNFDLNVMNMDRVSKNSNIKRKRRMD